jgi:hypothetical protein
MLLAGAGVPAAPRVEHGLVSLLDLRPTIQHAIGTIGDGGGGGGGSSRGRSLLTVAQRGGAAAEVEAEAGGEGDTGRVVVSQYHGATAATGAFMLVAGRHTLLSYF